MAGFANVLGGALSGLGAGLEQQVEDKRKQRLLEIENQYGNDRLDKEHGYRLGEQANQDTLETARDNARENRADARQNSADDRAAAREDVSHGYKLDEDAAAAKTRAAEDAGNVDHYETDDSGQVVGFTKAGKAVKTGITSGKADDKASSADDKLIARAERQATVKTTKRDEDGNAQTEESIDPTRVADFLRRNGRADLANGYVPQTQDDLIASTPANPRAPLETRDETALKTGKAPKGSRPVPANLTKEPDGTVVADKDNNKYVIRRGYLIPQ